MAEFKYDINRKAADLNADILHLTTRFDMIDIDVNALLDAMEDATKPCSWQFWMDKYFELVYELVRAGIVKEPVNSTLYKSYKEKGVAWEEQ
jgi:hypothetical protein